MRLQLSAALLTALALAACATTPPPQRITTAPPSPAYRPPTSPPAEKASSFAALPGWSQEDHAAALDAFRRGCEASAELELSVVCGRARALGPLDEAGARRFLEANFQPEIIPDQGLLTAYFAPVYEAREIPDGDFAAPVRPRPQDLPAADLNPGSGALYAERAQIEARPRDEALAWMRAEDLFFLQIQGSGVLVFPDGRRMKALFDGANGARFIGIARPMREQGLLADADTSGEAIRGWLAANRGPRADAVMDLNPRYVFFRLTPDDGADPAGAAGRPLIPGRTLAVDLSRHALGEVFWIDAEAPALAGAFPAYRRLAIALDTGGAIKGDVRADLYMGRGPQAGAEAGRVRHVLRLYRLTPMLTPRS